MIFLLKRNWKLLTYHVWILTIKTIGQTTGLIIKGKYKIQRGFEGLAFTVFECLHHQNSVVLFFYEEGLCLFY